jgi:hypothetical protein
MLIHTEQTGPTRQQNRFSASCTFRKSDRRPKLHIVHRNSSRGIGPVTRPSTTIVAEAVFQEIRQVLPAAYSGRASRVCEQTPCDKRDAVASDRVRHSGESLDDAQNGESMQEVRSIDPAGELAFSCGRHLALSSATLHPSCKISPFLAPIQDGPKPKPRILTACRSFLTLYFVHCRGLIRSLST